MHFVDDEAIVQTFLYLIICLHIIWNTNKIRTKGMDSQKNDLLSWGKFKP